MKLTDKQRQKTARHEAGHALVNILQGVPFDLVWIRGCDGEPQGEASDLDVEGAYGEVYVKGNFHCDPDA